jgi:hypothetical protein
VPKFLPESCNPRKLLSFMKRIKKTRKQFYLRRALYQLVNHKNEQPFGAPSA